MTRQLIERLATLPPKYSPNRIANISPHRQLYCSTDYGWEFATDCADACLDFPCIPEGRDEWLLRAYMMRRHPTNHHNTSVINAFFISRCPFKSGLLKALLIAGLGNPIDEHISLVAKHGGHARNVVEAFEILFFNVLDRSKDGAYIANVVYPHTRAVEFEEGYLEHTPIALLLLRAAHSSRDVEFIIHLAGLPQAAFKEELMKMSRQEAQLESDIVGNALLMAQFGLINQPSIGLQRATKLLTDKGRRSKRQGQGGDSQSSATSSEDPYFLPEIDLHHKGWPTTIPASPLGSSGANGDASPLDTPALAAATAPTPLQTDANQVTCF